MAEGAAAAQPAPGTARRPTPWRTAAESLLPIARNPDLRRLALSFGGSMTVDWAFTVALGVFAYREGGAGAVGIVGVVRMLPAALLTPFASAFADRHERERVLLAVALVSSAALTAATAAFYLDTGAAGVFAVAAVQSLASMLFRPVSGALMPSLATTPEEVVAANGAFSTLEGLGTLAGPLLAGVLVETASPGVVFAACAGIYAVVALALARIRPEGRPAAAAADVSPAAELLAGLRVALASAQLRALIGLFAVQSAIRGALNVLIVVAAFRLLHAGSGWVGFLSAAIGAGGLLGGLAATSLAGRRLAAPFALGLLCWGVPVALVAAAPHRLPALLLLGVLGIGNAIEDVAGLTLLQRLADDDVLGRVQGVLFGAATAAVGLGAAAEPGLVSWLGARGAFVATGALLPALVLLFWPQLRRIDAVAAAPTEQLVRLQAVPMFAPLPVAAKEHVAARLVPLEAAAGTEIVREGEPGDRFYLVVDGAVRVTVRGRELPVDGPYVGEIALVEDSPRTATVTATEDTRLYALERDDFLAAVTGHSRSSDAARGVVAGRLASYERTGAGRSGRGL